MRLAPCPGYGARLWLNLQAAYGLAVAEAEQGRCGITRHEKTPDGLAFDLIAQARMKAIARGPVDRRPEASLQYRFDGDRIECIERAAGSASMNIPASLPSPAASRAVDSKR
jgi:hypothetical protein